jgi:hypothetical protein
VKQLGRRVNNFNEKIYTIYETKVFFPLLTAVLGNEQLHLHSTRQSGKENAGLLDDFVSSS